MNIKFIFDFHDVFVDARKAWLTVFEEKTKDKNVLKLYNDGVPKKDICRLYNLSYGEMEEEYRKILDPINKNIEFAESLRKIYEISIVSMARKERLLKDIQKFGLENMFVNIYSKEDYADRKRFLKQLSENYEWLVFFNHEIKEINIDGKVIYIPINFQGDISKFEKISFTEHAKSKLIYNELSNIYMQSIANDTTEETMFLDNIFKIYGKDKGSILDCCCGVGRHCKALAKCGYIVTGIDISKSQIENAKKINAGDNISYYNMDVRNINLSKKNFDAGICMWTTYNYLSQDEDLKKFMKCAYEHLSEDGLFVLDSKNIPALDKNRIYNRKNISSNLDLELLICKRIVGNVQNSQYFYFMKRDGKNEFYMDEEFVRFYYLNEIKEIVNEYFDIVNVFGDFDMSEYNEKISRRFIIVLKKK